MRVFVGCWPINHLFNSKHVGEFGEHGDRLKTSGKGPATTHLVPGCRPDDGCLCFYTVFHAWHIREIVAKQLGHVIYTRVESKTRTYHGQVGTGRRTAGRRGGAGLGRVGRRWVSLPRRQPSLIPSRRSKKTLLGMSLEARTKETLCKPMEEQNVRLTRGLFVVCPRDDGRSSFVAADQCTDA